MKRKLFVISAFMVVFLGIIYMFYHNERIEHASLLAEKRQEVIDQLSNHLSYFNPALDAFADKDYKTTVASTISSEGVVEYERGLAKKNLH